MDLDVGISGIFWQSFREDVHQLLAWGHTDVKDRLSPNDDEEEITGDICDAIKKRLKAPQIPSRFFRYEIQNEVPFSPRGERGKKRRKLDLVILSTVHNREIYVMEAKRLKTNGFGIGKYLGSEGLGCFVSGTYAPTEPEAAMVAYVQNKGMTYWQKELFDKIGESIEQRAVISDIPNEWKSRHDRPDGTGITIFHIFLDCSEN